MSIFGMIKDAIWGHKAAAAPEPVAAAETAAAPAPEAPAAQAPAQVDVEAVMEAHAQEHPGLNWRSSIVDMMKMLDLDSSLEHRKELAKELGYTGELDGSAEMNIWLHKAVMAELEKNGGLVPASMAD